MFRALMLAVVAVCLLLGHTEAKSGCPNGTVPIAGRCLPPDLAEAVRAAPTVDGRASEPKTGQACCKRCTKGVPCGNSCISASKTCRKPSGCAC